MSDVVKAALLGLGEVAENVMAHLRVQTGY